jgi:hypothetical protein
MISMPVPVLLEKRGIVLSIAGDSTVVTSTTGTCLNLVIGQGTWPQVECPVTRLIALAWISQTP